MVRSGLGGGGRSKWRDSTRGVPTGRCQKGDGDYSAGARRLRAPNSRAFDYGDGRRLPRLIPAGRHAEPHRPQHRDDLALDAQARVCLIVRGGGRPLVGALEGVVAPRAGRRVEGFPRHIFEPPAPGPVLLRMPRRLPVARAVTDAQPAVTPELALGAEAPRRLDVSTLCGRPRWGRHQAPSGATPPRGRPGPRPP